MEEKTFFSASEENAIVCSTDGWTQLDSSVSPLSEKMGGSMVNRWLTNGE